MKKVFLECLPKKGSLIDWKESVGIKIPFAYENIKGQLLILDYHNNYITFTNNINGKKCTMHSGSFVNCHFSKVLGITSSNFNFKFSVNTTLIDKNRNLTVLENIHVPIKEKSGRVYNYKFYKCKCNICGWISDSGNLFLESNLVKGRGCPVCCKSPRIVVEGINDIPTTAPWMVKYFQGGYDEVKLYTKQSNKKIYPICPDCKRVKKKKMSISTIYTQESISCICSDGISYPNKFVYNLLKQLNTNYETEKIFSWSFKKRYDVYIDFCNIIIENNGIQHYKKSFTNFEGRTLQEEQENDKLKEKLAKENGIEHYIVLDCQKSELEWIKNSVMNSELPTLLGFKEEDIDWSKCHEFALSNLAKEVYDYKNNNPEKTVDDISILFNLHKSTVMKYIKNIEH